MTQSQPPGHTSVDWTGETIPEAVRDDGLGQDVQQGGEEGPTLSEAFWRSLCEPGTGLPTRLGPVESRGGCFLLTRLLHIIWHMTGTQQEPSGEVPAEDGSGPLIPGKIWVGRYSQWAV